MPSIAKEGELTKNAFLIVRWLIACFGHFGSSKLFGNGERNKYEKQNNNIAMPVRPQIMCKINKNRFYNDPPLFLISNQFRSFAASFQSQLHSHPFRGIIIIWLYLSIFMQHHPAQHRKRCNAVTNAIHFQPFGRVYTHIPYSTHNIPSHVQSRGFISVDVP